MGSLAEHSPHSLCSPLHNTEGREGKLENVQGGVDIKSRSGGADQRARKGGEEVTECVEEEEEESPSPPPSELVLVSCGGGMRVRLAGRNGARWMVDTESRSGMAGQGGRAGEGGRNLRDQKKKKKMMLTQMKAALVEPPCHDRPRRRQRLRPIRRWARNKKSRRQPLW